MYRPPRERKRRHRARVRPRIPRRDELPVVLSTKFQFVLNLRTARALGVEVPPGVLSIADEAIEQNPMRIWAGPSPVEV